MMGRRFLVTGRRWIRAVPWKGVAGIAVATPLIAIVQGTVLLQEYRRNHLHQPCPDIPSRGLVVVERSNKSTDNPGDEHVHLDEHDNAAREKHESGRPSAELLVDNQEHDREHTHDDRSIRSQRIRRNRTKEVDIDLSTCTARPLRILVIGDSLAAGVGTSQQGTPVLPEAVAQALSRALDGRAVLWTCVGVPGQTASETVNDICRLDDVFLASSLLSSSSSSTTLLRQWDEWQVAQRRKAVERIEAAKLKTQAWLDYCKAQRLHDEETMETTKWWKQISMQIRRDIEALRRIISKTETGHTAHASTNNVVTPPIPTPIQSPQGGLPLADDSIGPYDVAIVLTGCNDLKESYLPFMMKARSREKELTDVHNSGNTDQSRLNDSAHSAKKGGITYELMRILHALESKMIQRIILPTQVLGSELERNDTPHKGPLIVFPAMPFEATTLGQRFPLSLFVSPLLQMIDRHKQILSERYPGRVLYVPSPDSSTWSDFEAKRGPQWQDFNVLLKLNDIAQDAKERIEQLMQRHYASWVRDDDEIETNSAHNVEIGDSTYKIDDVEGMWMRTAGVQSSRRSFGNKLVAPDGIHPSDSGYDMWGRHIACAIVQEWDRQQHQ